MSGEDQLEYGTAALRRIALAAQLAAISDYAGDAVPTYPDRDAAPGDLARLAARLTADAGQLTALAIGCERSRGTSWDAIAEALGLSGGQAARDLYQGPLAQLDQAILEGWILGADGPPPGGIPPGAVGTAHVARELDDWVSRRQAAAGRPAPGDADPDHLFPVSGQLAPVSPAGHADLLAAAGALINERQLRSGPDDPHVRRLELGLARRAVRLYERMAAQPPADGGPSRRTLTDLLAGARARLAGLEGAAEAPGGSAAHEEP